MSARSPLPSRSDALALASSPALSPPLEARQCYRRHYRHRAPLVVFSLICRSYLRFLLAPALPRHPVSKHTSLAVLEHGEELSTIFPFFGVSTVVARMASAPSCSSPSLSARIVFAGAPRSFRTLPFALYQAGRASSPMSSATVLPWPAMGSVWCVSDQVRGSIVFASSGRTFGGAWFTVGGHRQ